MKLFCCQHDIIWENKAANHAKARALLELAHIPAESLVLLPEMFATGFSMKVPEIREDAKGETTQFLIQTAREMGIYLMAGVVVAGGDKRGRNQAVVFTPEGKETARYSKMQ